jgi:hypothetical protein
MKKDTENLKKLAIKNPVGNVIWVPVDEVVANDYNPNIVATQELKLLAISILHDGYTQPIVTVKSDSYDLKLPCGIISQDLNSLKNNPLLWNYLKNHLEKSSPIRLGLLKEMDVSASIEKQIDTQLEFRKEKKIKEKNGVNGLENNGVLDIFKDKAGKGMVVLEQPIFGIGKSTDLMKQNSYLIAFCPICLSREKKHWKHWNTFITEPTESTKEIGMILKCNSLKTIGKKSAIKKLQKSSKEQSMQSEQKEPNLDYSEKLEIIDKSQYVIVDGYHRYFVMKTNKKVAELTGGMLPIVVLKKDINDRMASTIRHNRARGKHTINGMSQLVFQMVQNGWDDLKICNELGLEADELLRLKHMTGVASLFKDKDYTKSWEEGYQIKERIKKG